MMPKLLPTRSTRPCFSSWRHDLLERAAGDQQVDLGGGPAEDEVADEAADGVDVPPEKPDEERPAGEVEAKLGHSAAVNLARTSLTASLWAMNIRHFSRT